MAFLVGSAARCSSSSGNVVADNTDDGGGTTSSSGTGTTSSSGTGTTSSSGTGTTSSSSGTGTTSSSGSSGGVVLTDASAGNTGTDGGCVGSDTQVLATKISFPVQWPQGGIAAAAGMGTVNIWLLTNFSGTTTLTGTSQTCGTTLPDLLLTSTGATAANMSGQTVKVQITLPYASVWKNVTRTFTTSGTQSGFEVGDSENTNAVVGMVGLAQTSSYLMDSTAWPINCPATGCTGSDWFPASAIVDDDNDGKPGITAVPSTTNGYTQPPTNAVCGQPSDKIYIVSRNEIQVTGMRMTCGTGTGTATLKLFDNHVVGCHVADIAAHGVCPAATAADCSASEIAFLDDNRTIYGYDQTAGDTFSPSHPATGTATIVSLKSGATCSDVLTALP
jgi:hypothetical protein